MNFEERKAHWSKQSRVDNAALPAGSPMFYYCRECGAEIVEDELHVYSAPLFCPECIAEGRGSTMVRAPVPIEESPLFLLCLQKGHCPDCGGTDWRPGPMGGLASNEECRKCLARFNVSRHGDEIVFAQRIERESEGGSKWPDYIFQKGDRVRVTCGDRTVDAVITIASPNGYSLMLEFEAILDGHVGAMPVTATGGDQYFAVIGGTKLTIEPKRQ